MRTVILHGFAAAGHDFYRTVFDCLYAYGKFARIIRKSAAAGRGYAFSNSQYYDTHYSVMFCGKTDAFKR